MLVCLRCKSRDLVGFTLIEVLCALAIISLLVGGLLVAGAGAAQSGYKSQARTQMALIADALEQFKLRYGEYPPADCQDSRELFYALTGKAGYSGSGSSLTWVHFEKERPSLIDIQRFYLNQAGDALVDPWSSESSERTYLYGYAPLSQLQAGGAGNSKACRFVLVCQGHSTHSPQIPSDGIITPSVLQENSGCIYYEYP